MSTKTSQKKPQSQKMHVKKGDTVQVITGHDKGKVGEVLQALPQKSQVIIKGVNIRTKHMKPRAEGESGQIVTSEAPIHSSNVMHYSNKEKIASRISYTFTSEGKKVRMLKKQAKFLTNKQKYAPDQAQENKEMPPRLKQVYQETIAPKLKEQFSYQNVHEIPKVMKVTVNRGLGEASQNAKALESSIKELAMITGQQPVVTRAKKAIAGFKIREGMPVGVMVTLRSDRMYAFLDRFINLALPRIRDFRGVSADSFDGRGNYSIGIREQLIFPEIEYDSIDQIRGMDISIITTAKTDEEGRALLKEMGMPFRTN